ncbi:MAG: A/G-specific adenine glycosylase, partial [Nitriliruptorales bacterium]
MLQQTQVSRVAARYLAFLDAFPTATRCAEAPAAAVIRLWDGLGYNRRARNLHRAAAHLAERHGGRVPDDLDALLALPGVGPYTARAVLSFAFERDVGVVETNIGRVLARAVAGESLSSGGAQRLADDLVPPGRSRAWNLALMDLGAEVCRKRDPRCHACPVASTCAW